MTFGRGAEPFSPVWWDLITHLQRLFAFCYIFIFLFTPAIAATANGKGYDRQYYGVGDWRLAIVRGRFSADLVCALYTQDNKMHYVENAIGFQLGRKADVLQSWYRIDGGTPLRWRDQLPELARLGVAVDGRSMDRPTDGLVWLPVDQLDGAATVEIQPLPGKKTRRFSLDGFWRLYDYAIDNGCTPESRFAP